MWCNVKQDDLKDGDFNGRARAVIPDVRQSVLTGKVGSREIEGILKGKSLHSSAGIFSVWLVGKMQLQVWDPDGRVAAKRKAEREMKR